MSTQIFQQPVLIWFILGLVLVISEFAVPGVVIVFFGIGAWMVALILLIMDIPFILQLLIFLGTSVGTLLLVRKRLVRSGPDRTPADVEMIGNLAQVHQRFSRGEFGKVKYKGALWKARTESETILESGDYVKIVGNDSITLNVEPVPREEKEE